MQHTGAMDKWKTIQTNRKIKKDKKVAIPEMSVKI